MIEKKISLDEAFKIAVDLHSKGNLKEAKNIFEKILKAKPNHFLSLANLILLIKVALANSFGSEPPTCNARGFSK